eukprot:scaffold5_cov169-Amphora_coffeaeformis.AAC.9
MDRCSRRQRARRLKAELVAAYLEGDRPLAPVRHFLPSSSNNDKSSDTPSRYHVVDWIEQDPAILWEPFAAGSTVMHWTSQHLRFEHINHSTNSPNVWKSADHTTVISDPWEWLMELVAANNPDMLTRQRDGGGESCLDCFQSAWLHGSRRNDPYQFSTAVDAIRQQPHLLDQLQRMLERDENKPSSKPLGRAGDRRVMLVCKVWKAWQRLCEAANTNGESLIAFMARTGRAMESFAWLAVTLHSKECQLSNPKGELPLHLWASSPAVTTEEMDGLVGYLLQAYPQAVSRPDADGRLPLHRALARSNKPLRQAQMLALACPETLALPDPQGEGGLYPFAMAAHAARLEVRAAMRATQRRHPSQRLYDWLDTCRRDMDTYEQEVSTVLLGHVYVMLRALPQALEHIRNATTQEQEADETVSQNPATNSTATTVKDAYSKILHDLV